MTHAATPKLGAYAGLAALGLLGALATRRPELVVLAAPFALSAALGLLLALVRRIPEDVSVLNKFWHAVVEKRSKEYKGEWSGFLQGGKDAMATMT